MTNRQTKTTQYIAISKISASHRINLQGRQALCNLGQFVLSECSDSKFNDVKVGTPAWFIAHNLHNFDLINKSFIT